MAPDNETIAAVATAAGPAGVSVVRVSGPLSGEIARSITHRQLTPRLATYTSFRDSDGQPFDKGVALYFPAPHSLTGEPVLELQGHGGDMAPALLLQATLQAGARLARPGEFSERAFRNNKMDLAQAEAVGDLIYSASQASARAAFRSLSGEFSEQIHLQVDAVLQLRTLTEAHLDFPEEEIAFDPPAEALNALEARLSRLIQRAHQGRLLRDGARVVLAGPPNAGKSSLMNRLTDAPTSIVASTPGTTRDILRVSVVMEGVRLHLTDTAGLRADPEGEVEAEGVARARQSLEQADLIVWMTATDTFDEPPPDCLQVRLLRVHNKIDLDARLQPGVETDGRLHVSVKTGQGLDELESTILKMLGAEGSFEGSFTARQRHLEALDRALKHVRLALKNTTAPELLAESLRDAQNALGEITGEVTTEDLLGQIFSSFCIGK